MKVYVQPQAGICNDQAAKQAELEKTIVTLKRQGIIVNSDATHYSQVLMVPKPDGSSRMCIDYRGLDEMHLRNHTIQKQLACVDRFVASSEGCWE